MKLFSPRQIQLMNTGAIRKAYSELRSVANKRIQRMTAQNLGRDRSLFPTIQQIVDSDKISLKSALADVSKFLRSERTTVRGEKKFLNEFRRSMIEKGYGELVQSNKDVYGMLDYMDHLREIYSEKLFDSGDALDVLEQGQRLNIPVDKLKDNYELFASNIEKMEKLRPSPKGAEFSQRRINNLIKKWL